MNLTHERYLLDIFMVQRICTWVTYKNSYLTSNRVPEFDTTCVWAYFHSISAELICVNACSIEFDTLCIELEHFTSCLN